MRLPTATFHHPTHTSQIGVTSEVLQKLKTWQSTEVASQTSLTILHKLVRDHKSRTNSLRQINSTKTSKADQTSWEHNLTVEPATNREDNSQTSTIKLYQLVRVGAVRQGENTCYGSPFEHSWSLSKKQCTKRK